MSNKNNLFSQVASKLELPTAAIYGVLVFIVSVVGVIITAQASLGQQSLSSQATNYQIVGCNQPCASNRNCEANHYCFMGKCRLASAPEDETCQRIETTDASQDPTQKGYDPELDPDSGLNVSNPIEIDEQQQDSLTPESPMNKLNQAVSGKNYNIALFLGLGIIGLVIVIALSSLLGSKSSTSKTIQPTTPTKKTPNPDFSGLENHMSDAKKLEIKKTETIK